MTSCFVVYPRLSVALWPAKILTLYTIMLVIRYFFLLSSFIRIPSFTVLSLESWVLSLLQAWKPLKIDFFPPTSFSNNHGQKWKWRNDRRSERNLCNCAKKPEKHSGLQRGLSPWPRNTGAMLYQLSYEAIDVGSRSILGSYVPVKEMSVNDIWNKSYRNCGNEMKMKKWSSQWTKLLDSS